MSTEPIKQYVSVAEACVIFGTGATRMRELLRQNQITAVRLGARVLVSVESATAYFQSLPRLNDQ